MSIANVILTIAISAFLVLVIGIIIYNKRQEKRRYEALSPLDKLWEDYKKLNPLSPSGQHVAGKIEACLIAEIQASKTRDELNCKTLDFLSTSTTSKANFLSRPGSSMKRVLSERTAELQEKEKLQAEEERAKLKEELLKKIFNAQTATDAMMVYRECPKGSLESWFALFMHEKLAKLAVEEATSIDDIVAAATIAPTEAFPSNTALYIAFLKLHTRYQHNL